jgi:hypothetical protein
MAASASVSGQAGLKPLSAFLCFAAYLFPYWGLFVASRRSWRAVGALQRHCVVAAVTSHVSGAVNLAGAAAGRALTG